MDMDWTRLARDVLVLLLLAFIYWLLARYAMVMATGWTHDLRPTLSLPGKAVPFVRSGLDGLLLALVSIPIAGFAVNLSPQRAVGYALLVAIPAACDPAWAVWHFWQTWHWAMQASSGFNGFRATLGFGLFDTIKTLILPPLLTWPVRHWVAAHP